jgi:two-component system OmpR family sensor kinase
VLLLVLGSFAVRVALRPLEAVERTAEEIAEGDLSRRVPVARGTTEIGRLATTLNVMLGKVEAAFQAQHYSETTLRQFVADASHELRTPLTAIRGYAELDRKGALVDAAARDHAMRRIESEATRMGVLVDDLLLLAHLDQQRPLDVSTVDLAVLLTEGVADARAQDPDRPIEFHPPDEPVLVDVDADRFRQVVANLLGNAIAHTPSGTGVTVTLTVTPATADGRAVFTVADDGPGLTADQVSRLFERFYRADPSRTRRGRGGGSGLGLSIVQSVVAASHGAVEAASEPGRGTTFTVSLPVHAPTDV